MIKIILIATVALASCATVLPSSSVEKLRWLNTADPLVDARASFSKKDYRFYAVRGYDVEVPGANTCQIEAVGKKIIEETSDGFSDWEHLKLNEIAKLYAFMYNIEMSRLLESGNITDC